MSSIVYPDTKREETYDEYHGEKVHDAYQWLEDPDSKETVAWVEQQNNISEPILSTTESRSKLKERLTEVFNYERYSCPFKRGDSYFYYKNDGLQDQSVLYKAKSLESKEGTDDVVVFLDPNKLSDDGTAALRMKAFTESGSHMAYGVSRSGSDWQSIYVRDVETCEDLTLDDSKEALEWVKFSSISWTHDDKGFFYSRYPKPEVLDENDEDFKRGSETQAASNQSVYYHTVGTPQSSDVKVFSFPDNPKWMASAEVTSDGEFVCVSIGESCDPVNRFYYCSIKEVLAFVQASSSSSATAGDASSGSGSDTVKPLPLVKLIDTFDNKYDYLYNEGRVFYFRTNYEAPRNKVISIDLSLSLAQQQNPENWVDVIPHPTDAATVLQDVVVVNQNQLVCCFMTHVKEQLSLYDLKGNCLQPAFPLPDIGTIASLSGRKKDSILFYKFTSFLYPGTIYYVDLSKTTDDASDSDSKSQGQYEATVFRETQLKDFDASRFETKQVFYTSKDGTRIPMFVISKKDLVLDGSHPTLLYGYGGFNISLTPSCSISRLVFVQNLGGVVCVPNLRGGGEYGNDWHKAGTKLKKQNVFDDFIAAAEFLIEQKYTSSAKLSIMGGSNGGLLVGACLNQRPELYGCGIAAVGVMDMLKFHKFTIGYAWCSDFGCSDNEDEYNALKAYSPVHNINADTPYPATLLTTADHDDRVVPLHSFKYMAALQHVVKQNSAQVAPVIIRIECKAGHGAGKPLHKIIDEQADIYGFIAKSVGASWRK